ncbi:Na/Pi symporter [Winogradskyella sp.]|uniref:Na/Pi cotransporter family protein n=1 Tax=Winogradskyella sp. TaxID=1883156 RepID=UPI00262F6552|nr:Na/Pi symporter [Winogradskyella sp.]
MTEILPLLIGGLALFLYAIAQLSETLTELFTERAKEIVKTYTSNIFSAIAIGTLLTILMGSSSAMIIIVIVFINAKSLNFKQSIGLIMGANIGTTFSSQIIALDIGKYAVIALFVGLIFEVFVKNKQRRLYGKGILYFGMLFFGLYIMENALGPLKNSQTFLDWIAKVEGHPVQGALIGGLVTLIIQSSSGTVGMAILLGKQNVLSIAGGIAIMLGAELGTCSDTLLATINGRREALKAGLFHLCFNLTTIIMGLFLFQPFVSLVNAVSRTTDIGGIIANAHMLFNILGVLVFLPFVRLSEKLLNSLLPDKKSTPKNIEA